MGIIMKTLTVALLLGAVSPIRFASGLDDEEVASIEAEMYERRQIQEKPKNANETKSFARETPESANATKSFSKEKPKETKSFAQPIGQMLSQSQLHAKWVELPNCGKQDLGADETPLKVDLS